MMPQNIIKPPRMSYHARLTEAKLRSSRGSPLKLVISAESLQDSCESSASPPPALTHSPLSATPSTSSSTSSSPTLSQHESSNPEPCSALMMPPVMTSLPSFGNAVFYDEDFKVYEGHDRDYGDDSYEGYGGTESDDDFNNEFEGNIQAA
ncbi:hypothetical protein BGZ81_009058 [Podila clonocystis]|nr:hypothetical protein BGZ81_009058 [Podila clonocystis]